MSTRAANLAYATYRYARATRALRLRAALPRVNPGTAGTGPAAGARRKYALAVTRAAAATYALGYYTGGPPTTPAAVRAANAALAANAYPPAPGPGVRPLPTGPYAPPLPPTRLP